jgi:membrane-bound metal-dependent hydrolase YbcI (DUF457 family)
MKGISHFAMGVATASCFPAAVEAGANGNPLYFLLGGAFGLLPDTLDFKFYRPFHRHDVEVTPDPNRPDAEQIARAVAWALDRAASTGGPVRLKLNTVRLAADRWQRYTVRFNVADRRVEAAYGPVVDTGGRPEDGAAPARDGGPGLAASAPVSCAIRLDYQATTQVDIFDGASFTMEPAPDGTVIPRFIPWHREWSHGFVTGALLAAPVALFGGAWAGVVAFAAYAAHVLADQLGYLGSNLFFPFTRDRTPGLRLTRSGGSRANALAVWLSCLVVFWNLYAANPPPGTDLNPLKLLVFGLALPDAVWRLANRFWRDESRGSDTGATLTHEETA